MTRARAGKGGGVTLPQVHRSACSNLRALCSGNGILLVALAVVSRLSSIQSVNYRGNYGNLMYFFSATFIYFNAIYGITINKIVCIVLFSCMQIQNQLTVEREADRNGDRRSMLHCTNKCRAVLCSGSFGTGKWQLWK